MYFTITKLPHTYISFDENKEQSCECLSQSIARNMPVLEEKWYSTFKVV